MVISLAAAFSGIFTRFYRVSYGIATSRRARHNYPLHDYAIIFYVISIHLSSVFTLDTQKKFYARYAKKVYNRYAKKFTLVTQKNLQFSTIKNQPSYSTDFKTSPRAGIVFPARLLSPFSSISSTSATEILPSPAATRVPAIILTIL